VHPRRRHRGCKPTEQGQRIHLDGDGAVGEGTAQLDAHQAAGRELQPLLGDGRPEQVAKQGQATELVVGLDGGGGVLGEAHSVAASGPVISTPARPRRVMAGTGRQGPVATIGAGGHEAADRGSGELGKGRLAHGEVVGQQDEIVGLLDDAAALEQAQSRR
jgi:hypothetical protein